MAKSQRIMLRVQPETYDVLKRLSEATGQPMASLVTAYLKDSLPALEALAEAFEKIKAGRPQEAKKLLSGFALKTTHDLTGEALKLNEKSKGEKKG